nr:ribosomal protein S10 [Acorus tatarinowii]
MEIHKVLILFSEKHLRKKYFRLKRQRLFGAQYEIVNSYKTRSDKDKVQIVAKKLGV